MFDMFIFKQTPKWPYSMFDRSMNIAVMLMTNNDASFVLTPIVMNMSTLSSLLLETLYRNTEMICDPYNSLGKNVNMVQFKI